eukprot:CAMPEP_0182591886 /NCGR_PEP_ID=MMETSP1324-20130603/74776_1 /TAXON_ID=236786 /ORGANISM="Florenciella sp., Strain RCC1587" /LENGTH=74 /DNA_ID=CAMNT_0024809233 /DNA_START=221 /DNA_END=442 /DNA_ORIENTATION=-
MQSCSNELHANTSKPKISSTPINADDPATPPPPPPPPPGEAAAPRVGVRLLGLLEVAFALLRIAAPCDVDSDLL